MELDQRAGHCGGPPALATGRRQRAVHRLVVRDWGCRDGVRPLVLGGPGASTLGAHGAGLVERFAPQPGVRAPRVEWLAFSPGLGAVHPQLLLPDHTRSKPAPRTGGRVVVSRD